MSVRVEVRPELIEWALDRARVPDEARSGMAHVEAWLDGTSQPTLKQLQDFAQKTHAPLGYLLLPEPPHEDLPIPDFRTVAGTERARPSVDLLDTIYLCQQRQDWFRDYARTIAEQPLEFVGTATRNTSIATAAAQLDDLLGWTAERQAQQPKWADALRLLREAAEDVGVLVMISGVVGLNTHRSFDPDEFRGFALVDEWAPLVFVNGKDTKAAQVFTLVHELAHILLGAQGVSDLDRASLRDDSVERWCNRVAAELLVPAAELISEYEPDRPTTQELDRLARRFCVSTLVILLQLRQADFFDRDTFAELYDEELDRLMGFDRSSSDGGSFYSTFPVQNSRRFLQSIISNTLEGQTLYQDAFRLTGLRKQETFDKMAEHLGVA